MTPLGIWIGKSCIIIFSDSVGAATKDYHQQFNFMTFAFNGCNFVQKIFTGVFSSRLSTLYLQVGQLALLQAHNCSVFHTDCDL